MGNKEKGERKIISTESSSKDGSAIFVLAYTGQENAINPYTKFDKEGDC